MTTYAVDIKHLGQPWQRLRQRFECRTTARAVMYFVKTYLHARRGRTVKVKR